eukprot:superscaffoldBa00002579_g14710
MYEASDRADLSEKPAPPNWILQHPAYQQMKNLEVGDSAQVHAAFLVYMDLTEVRRWKDVSCVKSSELEVIFLHISILPLFPSSLLCSIRHVLDRGCPMLLCAVASDSTLVYQRMTDGLVTPDPPAGPFQDVGRRQHRKRRQQH